jgi:hypothetical protein
MQWPQQRVTVVNYDRKLLTNGPQAVANVIHIYGLKLQLEKNKLGRK